MIEVRRIAGDSEVARELLVAMEAYVEADLGPVTAEATSTVDPGEMNPPDGAYVIVLEDGFPVAGGGVRRLGEDVAEVKRMYTLPDARGRGHGRRLLSAMEDAARELGYAAGAAGHGGDDGRRAPALRRRGLRGDRRLQRQFLCRLLG